MVFAAPVVDENPTPGRIRCFATPPSVQLWAPPANFTYLARSRPGSQHILSENVVNSKAVEVVGFIVRTR